MDTDTTSSDVTTDPTASTTPHRDDRRAKMTATFGHGYAAVIGRAAELHHSLAVVDTDPLCRPSEAERVSVAHAETRYRAANTLAALREAAELILKAAPFNKKDPAARELVSLHIWRIVRAIEKDETHLRATEQSAGH